MAKKNYNIDTSVFLTDADALFAFDNNDVFIHLKVLEEIDQVKINPSLIQPSKEIKSIGNFDVIINLHPEVQTQIVIKAIAQEEAK